jgi:hypothetical protein
MNLKLLHNVQALMDRSDWKDTPLLSQLEVLEVLDAQSQVLKAQVLPHGAANTVSPRLLQAKHCLCDCAALCHHALQAKWQCCAYMMSFCHHWLLANIPGTWQTYMMLAAGIRVCHVPASLWCMSSSAQLSYLLLGPAQMGNASQGLSIVKSLSIVQRLSVNIVLCICTLIDACPAMLAACGSHVMAHTCMH